MRRAPSVSVSSKFRSSAQPISRREKLIHVQPKQESYALRQLKDEVNLNLTASGERFRLNEKNVSGLLRMFGFLNRKRTNSGWVVLIDRAARGHIHQMVSHYGLNSSTAEWFPEPCEFCQAQKDNEATESRLMKLGFKVPDSPDRMLASLLLIDELSEEEWHAMLNRFDYDRANSGIWGEPESAPAEAASEVPPETESREHNNTGEPQNSDEPKSGAPSTTSEVQPETSAHEESGASNDQPSENREHKEGVKDSKDSTRYVPKPEEDARDELLKEEIQTSIIAHENREDFRDP